MKKLTEEDQLTLQELRNDYMITCDSLATMLNAKTNHIHDAQIGKLVPDDVADAIVDWMEKIG